MHQGLYYRVKLLILLSNALSQKGYEPKQKTSVTMVYLRSQSSYHIFNYPEGEKSLPTLLKDIPITHDIGDYINNLRLFVFLGALQYRLRMF